MRKDFGSKPWFYPMAGLGCPVRRLVPRGLAAPASAETETG